MALGPLIGIYIAFIIVGLLVVSGVMYLYMQALVFSRISFGLLVGLILTQNCPRLAEEGLINYGIYALIALAVIFGMSFFLRTDLAIRFTCSVLVSILLVSMLGVIICAFFDLKSIPFGPELAIKAICIIVPLNSLITNVSEFKSQFAAGEGKVYTHVQRGVASALYGMTMTFASVSLGGNWSWPEFVHVVLGIIVAVLAFIADYRYSTAVFGENVRSRVELMRAEEELMRTEEEYKKVQEKIEKFQAELMKDDLLDE